MLQLSVQDTGHGILPRIFEPFFSTTPGRGAVGLRICRDILRKHGGLIEVDSAPGAGTSVSVWLLGGDGEGA